MHPSWQHQAQPAPKPCVRWEEDQRITERRDCCDDLQDPELHKVLGVVDPYDTVPRLMDVAEIDQLGGALMRWMGLIGTPVKTADGAQSTQAEETAKNS